jgi:chromosome segregation ATPase
MARPRKVPQPPLPQQWAIEMPPGLLAEALVSALQQALLPLQQQIAGLQQDNAQLRSQIEDLVSHQAQAEQVLRQMTTEHSHLQQTLNALLKGLETGSSSDSSRQLQALLSALVTQLNELSQRVSSNLDGQERSLALLMNSLAALNDDASSGSSGSGSAPSR